MHQADQRPQPPLPTPGTTPGGHGHSHAHGPAQPSSRRVRLILAALVVPLALATLVGLVVLWPSGPTPKLEGLHENPLAYGTVTATAQQPCEALAGTPAPSPATGKLCARVTVRITAGPGTGRTVQQDVGTGSGNPRFAIGDEVVLAYAPNSPPEYQYQLVDFERRTPMLLLGAVFALAVVAFGRLRGLAALGALVLSFTGLVVFVLPAILAGANPLLVAVVGGSAIMLTALSLTHGLSARTSAAVLGTCVSLALIGLLGLLFIEAGNLTGLGSETGGQLGALFQRIDLRGLLLAGMVIGSLGVLDDVTVTQASVVWELRAANPGYRARQLYTAALRVGRDHIASTVNTLVLAYAGASLPLVLLFSVSSRGLLEAVSTEEIAQEVIRTLVGGIGLAASVPVTTALAALVAVQEQPEPVPTPPVDPATGQPVNRGRHRRG